MILVVPSSKIIIIIAVEALLSVSLEEKTHVGEEERNGACI